MHDGLRAAANPRPPRRSSPSPLLLRAPRPTTSRVGPSEGIIEGMRNNARNLHFITPSLFLRLLPHVLLTFFPAAAADAVLFPLRFSFVDFYPRTDGRRRPSAMDAEGAVNVGDSGRRRREGGRGRRDPSARALPRDIIDARGARMNEAREQHRASRRNIVIKRRMA